MLPEGTKLEPEDYQPPIRDRTLIGLVRLGVRFLEGFRRLGMATAETIRTRVREVVNTPPIDPGSNPGSISRAIRRALPIALRGARIIHTVEAIDRQNTPTLLDNPRADIDLKGQIGDELKSKLGKKLPLFEEIERVASICFYENIDPDRLIAFLESDEVLTFLVREVLKAGLPGFRGDNLTSAISSTTDAGIDRGRRFIKAKKEPPKKPIDEDIAQKIIKGELAFFRESYNPTSKTDTIFGFIEDLKKKYHEYDLQPWLEANIDLLIEILRGRAEEIYDTEKDNPGRRHVANVVNQVYYNRGKTNPDKFFDLKIKEFFRYDIAPELAYLRRHLKWERKPVFILDIPELMDFFEYHVDGLKNDQLGLFDLRKILIEKVLKYIDHLGPEEIILVIRDQNGKHELRKFQKIKNLKKGISALIRDNCRIISSHLDSTNILVEPTETPDEIKKQYREWFTPRGKLKKHKGNPYNNYLSGIFGGYRWSRGGLVREQFRNTVRRVTGIFEEVNHYLEEITKRQGKPGFTFPEVIRTNNYAELVKMACTSRRPIVRFAARRKIELATVIYSCMSNDVYKNRDYNAATIKEILETRPNGIQQIPEAGLTRIRFIDDPNGTVKEIPNESATDEPLPYEGETFNLIPAIFGNVRCHLLPATPDDTENYINKKDLFSAATTLIAETEERKRAHEITDWIRFTIAVDSEKDLIKVQENLENNYMSFGKALKRENKYGKFVKVTSFGNGQSISKSEDYKTLRYVLDMEVPEKKGKGTRIVPVEIRVMLREDLMKDKSQHDSTSHTQYKQRQLRIAESRLAPIEHFPERHIKEEPHPHDLKKRRRYKLKSAEEYKRAA